MALQDIDVPSLRGALNACLNSLDNSYTTDITSSLSGDSVWSGAAKDNLKTALETLSSTRYDELKEKINGYLGVADMIEQYQTAYSELKDLESELDEKQISLNYAKNNESSDSTYTNTLSQQISSLETDISNKKVELQNIEAAIVID